MSNHIYKSIEVTGSSEKDVEQAVANAVAKAGETLHNLNWFQVTETRGHIRDGKISHWQVTVKIGFRLD